MKKNRSSQSGFTLIEIMVAAVVGGVALAAAFAFARYQITAYRTQGEVASMNTSANILFQSMVRDIRSAGFGSSWYAGAPASAFGGNLAVAGAGFSRGIPALRPMNTSQAANTEMMPQSDAIMILRVEGDATHIPSSGPGSGPIPSVPGAGVGNSYLVDDPDKLRTCANRDIDGDGNPGTTLNTDGFVLVADMAHYTEPASMLLGIAAVPPNTQSPGSIFFDQNLGNTIGVNPSAANRVNPGNPAASDIAPNGFGPGSLIACVRPVTYWIDRRARLRLWRAGTLSPGGTAAGGAFGSVPHDPVRDQVLAEGVEELQISYLMSSAGPAALRNRWAFSTNALSTNNMTDMAETRAVRVSAILRTARTDETAIQPVRPVNLEDRTLPTNRLVGCVDPSNCYDPRYSRKTVYFQAELKNMRIFDRLSRATRTTNDIRSFPL